MKLTPVTKGEINSIICSLKPNNSSGYDGISSQIVTGVFPDHMKYAVMKPFFKKGVKEDITNYRTISLLTVFSKVLGKTIYHRLNQHLQVNHILVQEQFGFR
jgi:hypothetical protein